MRDMRQLIRRLADQGSPCCCPATNCQRCRNCATASQSSTAGASSTRAPSPICAVGRGRLPAAHHRRPARVQLVRSQSGVEHATNSEHGLAFQANERDVGELSLALGQAGIGILALTPELATLEDLFFRLTEDGNEAKPQAVPVG